MSFNLNESIEILARTPSIVRELLQGLSPKWLMTNEGPDTWSPYDVIGHLVVAESTNWLVRVQTILEHGDNQIFPPFDRFAHFEMSADKSLEQLLGAFTQLRQTNLQTLHSYHLSEADLKKVGRHPEFGTVTLGELLATWVVHDLSHVRQIVRTMAKQHETAVGPWRAYLSVFRS